jgi:hypothetical protein
MPLGKDFTTVDLIGATLLAIDGTKLYDVMILKVSVTRNYGRTVFRFIGYYSFIFEYF